MTTAEPCTRAAPVFDDAFRSELDTLFRWRRDVRHFQATPVPAATIDALLETASLAPSVGLCEPWRFVMVESPDRRAAVRANFEHCNAEALASQDPALAPAYARLKLEGIDKAPCQFALFADTDPVQGHGLGRRTMPETTAYSAVMAVHTLWLAARALGIGLGWVSILDLEVMHAILDVPRDWRFIGYFCLGYPQTEDNTPELQRFGWAERQPAAATMLRR
jgi:5,6-dimethylbenzimidazole synthase